MDRLRKNQQSLLKLTTVLKNQNVIMFDNVIQIEDDIKTLVD